MIRVVWSKKLSNYFNIRDRDEINDTCCDHIDMILVWSYSLAIVDVTKKGVIAIQTLNINPV